MNPLYLLLLLPILRGDRDWEDGRGFDKNLLLALVLFGQSGQLLGASGTATTSATTQPPFDPTVFLLLAMGTDLFGPGRRGSIRREELKEYLAILTAEEFGIKPNVNVNVELRA